jgi:predicted nucleic acid-binding protein
VLSFGADEARVAAELFNGSGRQRGTLVDCMLAASAISRDAALATSSRADFRRLEARGLNVVTA